MGKLLDTIFGKKGEGTGTGTIYRAPTAAVEVREEREEQKPWYWPLLGGIGSESGVAMSEQAALGLSAVFACVTVLSQDVASLPLKLYERLSERRKAPAYDHPLYDLLHNAPDKEMTSYKWRETSMGHLGTWGNAYSEIEFNGAGQITGLWPLRPDKMKSVTRDENGVVWYEYELPKSVGGQTRMLSSYRVLHVKGLGGNGLVGYTFFELQRNAMGLAKATETFGAKLFKNGAMPKVVLRHPGKLGDKAYDRLRESYLGEHEGLENAHRTAILEEGMDISTIGIPPEDAQFLETRRFQKSEIAAIYRVAPPMIQDLERATFANVEQLSINHVVYTLRPWLVNWEQEFWLKLLLPRERKRYFAEFVVDGLLRGDVVSRYQGYGVGRQNGWLSANDIRELENMDRIPGGDAYWQPLNMVEVGETPPEPAPVRASKGEAERAIASPQREVEEETRAKSAANKRRKLMNAYKPLYQDTANRILKREKREIAAAAEKYILSRSLPEFEAWLEEYYRGFADFVLATMKPLGTAYGKLVADEAGAEIDLAPDEAKVDEFTQTYVGGYAARHVGISQDRLKKADQKAGQTGQDPLEAVLDEIDDWPEGRASNIANEESTRFNNAIAKMVYMAAGIQKIQSMASGKSCPYCSSLDGKIIGIEENFISAGGSLEVDGAEPLTSTTDVAHAPYHGGCDCINVAVLG